MRLVPLVARRLPSSPYFWSQPISRPRCSRSPPQRGYQVPRPSSRSTSTISSRYRSGANQTPPLYEDPGRCSPGESTEVLQASHITDSTRHPHPPSSSTSISDAAGIMARTRTGHRVTMSFDHHHVITRTQSLRKCCAGYEKDMDVLSAAPSSAGQASPVSSRWMPTEVNRLSRPPMSPSAMTASPRSVRDELLPRRGKRHQGRRPRLSAFRRPRRIAESRASSRHAPDILEGSRRAVHAPTQRHHGLGARNTTIRQPHRTSAYLNRIRLRKVAERNISPRSTATRPSILRVILAPKHRVGG